MVLNKKMTTAGKVGLLLYLLALVLFLVGFSVPYWFVAQFLVEKHRYALWECCSDKAGTSGCLSIYTGTGPFENFILSTKVEKLRCGLWDCCFDKGGTSDCISIVTNTKPSANTKHFENFNTADVEQNTRCALGGTSACLSIITNTKRLEDFIFRTVKDLRCGLWDFCFDKDGTSSCVSIDINTKHPEDFSATGWYRGTQALACLALITIIANIVIRVLYIYCKSPRLYLVSVILDFIVAVLIFVAAAVFGYYTTNLRIYLIFPVNQHFGYAFNILGGIFFTGAAICFLIEFLRKK